MRIVLWALALIVLGLAVSTREGLGGVWSTMHTWFAYPGVITALVCAAYLTLFVAARSFFLARPSRELSLSWAARIKLDLNTLEDSGAPRPAALLEAVTAVEQRAGARKRLQLPWGSGTDLRDWQQLDRAEQLLCFVMPDDEVRARLAIRRLDPDMTPALASTIDDVLEEDSPRADTTRRVILQQERHRGDSAAEAAALLKWHRKTWWLAVVGLGLIVLAASTLQRWQLLVAGAVGGYFSRLWRAHQEQDVPDDYWSNWTNLMLAPIVGAFAGYGGVLLMHLLNSADVLGFLSDEVSWLNPARPGSLAAAFLFGFFEPLLQKLIDRLGSGNQEGKPEPGQAPPEAGPQDSAGAAAAGRAAVGAGEQSGAAGGEGDGRTDETGPRVKGVKGKGKGRKHKKGRKNKKGK